MRLALIIAVWCIALLALSEHQRQNNGAPVVKSAAAQSDTAKANYWLSPCPADRRNLPPIREEQA